MRPAPIAERPGLDAALPVEARGLVRRFGARTALGGVDLAVERGAITGLVGPNGSGKTTLLKLVAGLLEPSGGSVRVLGHEPFRERARVMRRARFAFAPPALFDALTAREHLRHLGALGAGAAPDARAIEAALDTVGLAERADDRVRDFSFGMRQRLVLAQALVPEPELLVLDEPTDGLDPLAVLELRGVLERLCRERGVTILLSSHLMVEIDELVDRVLVLAEGRALFEGPPASLCDDRRRLVLEVSEPELARAALAEHGHAAAVAERGRLELAGDALTLDEAQRLLAGRGVELRGFQAVRPSFEQALIARLRAHAAGGGRP